MRKLSKLLQKIVNGVVDEMQTAKVKMQKKCGVEIFGSW
jgi:hypothetical protein